MAGLELLRSDPPKSTLVPGRQRRLFCFAEPIRSRWAAALANIKIDGGDGEEGWSVGGSPGERVSVSGGFRGGVQKGACACVWVRGGARYPLPAGFGWAGWG